tara:strand:+ start:3708 stop:4424 length:717 start_codon:yes stop_codon:yes gene_type:complete
MNKNWSQISKKCLKENKLLISKKLSIHVFGNVSLRLDKNHFVIKPSGAKLEKINPAKLPIVNIQSEQKVSGDLKPSSDTLTHLEIYKKFDSIKSIAHSHSMYATSWAQAGKSIPLLGTTHADHWEKEIPIVNFISKNKVKNYEKNTGKLIIDCLRKNKLDIYKNPGIIVSGHGPFAWGNTYESAVLNLELLEYVSKLAYKSIEIGIKKMIPKYISNKHYQRKHGKNAYYGQNKSKNNN